MSEDNGRLANVIEAIDAANACDPNKIEHEGRLGPAELVYGWRMSATARAHVNRGARTFAYCGTWTARRAMDRASQLIPGRTDWLPKMAQGSAGFPCQPHR